MAKTRLVLVGGFLGAGKTTLLLHAADYLTGQGLRVGLVTNDQGKNLVDTALVRQRDFPVEEVSGSCFCCRFPDLLDAVRRLQAETRPDIILAEPVGSCTDLRATVMLPLQKYHASEFDLAPLTILVDPQRDLGHFPSTVTYLYRQQLSEAEVIALNKEDLLDPQSRREKIDVLKQAYPDAQVMSLSARTGNGIAEWVELSLALTSRIDRVLDIDYAIYAEAEATLGWLNTKLTLRSDMPLSPTDWITQTLESLHQAFAEKHLTVAHLKMHLSAPEAHFKASLTQLSEPITWDLQSNSTVIDRAEVILNARVNTTPARLHAIVEQVLQDVCQQRQIQFEYSHFECFSPLPPQPTFRFS